MSARAGAGKTTAVTSSVAIAMAAAALLTGSFATAPARGAVTAAWSVGNASAISRIKEAGQVLWAWGDAAGYHVDVYVGGRSRQVALLRPGNLDAAAWTGYECVSGDERYAAVVTAPAQAANSAEGRATGAFAYSINLATGRVRPVADMVSLVYYSPGCGTGDSAVLTTITPGDTSTTVRRVNLATGVITVNRTVTGQLTSAVPAGSTVSAVRRGSIVTLTRRGIRTVLADAGDVYDLVPATDGALNYLTAVGRAASAWREHSGRTMLIGTGKTSVAQLQNGESGRTVAIGLQLRAGAGVVSAGLAKGLNYPVASADGRTVLSAGRANSPRKVLITIGGKTRTSVLSPSLAHRTVADERAAAVSLRRTAAGVASAATSSPCAVPRGDPRRQVLQPDAAQVDWAIQMATADKLTGSFGRPAGYANLGQPAYAANTDFPAISLTDPSGSGDHSVPPLVFEAIAAQESNFSQASWHALPGIAGDPLIADYYGNGGDSIDTINYSKADCGYGVVQVTTGMHTGDPNYGPDEQARIAVDYEENIAAGLNILERTWNQLASLGIKANNGSPADLENWYFAAWAYNTGIHAESSHGTAGLGWSNNPANPDYPPSRKPFLEFTYADAAHPADWPYQERIMGWMASPLIQFGSPDYARAVYQGGNAWLQIPPFGIACAPTNYCTPPGGSGTPGCSLSDFECWWTGSATWVTDCAANCAIAPFTLPGTSEPPVTDPHPPTCDLNTGQVPSTAAGKPIIVDDLSSTGALNLVGCSISPNWRNSGTFTYTPGTNAAGQPVGMIDTHQLGAGFGGHILFTHLETASDLELINTGTWKPELPKLQYYDLRIHVPATGADATAAQYVLTPAPGAVPITIVVNQQVGETWINAGAYGMAKGATLALTNVGTSGLGTTDIAFDAVAFVPQGGTPTIMMKGSCPALDYVAARGSGQGGPGTPRWSSEKDDPLGIGAQLAPIGQGLIAGRPKGSVIEESIGYLADSIWKAAKWAPTYTRDLNQGVALTLADLRQHFGACGTRQRFVLAGYSQGAMVMHRALIALQTSNAHADQALLKQIAAVVLIADGDRHPGDDLKFSGTASHSSQGIAWEFTSLAHPPQSNLAKSLGSRTLSICDAKDYICDFPVGASAKDIALRAPEGIYIHTHHYKTTADVKSYVSWIMHQLG